MRRPIRLIRPVAGRHRGGRRPDQDRRRLPLPPKDRLAAELLAPCADDVIALLGAEFPDRGAFLDALVAFTVRHRTVLRLVMEDVGGADDAPPGSPGEAIRTFRDELFARPVGPEPDAAARVRGWAVLGALQWAVVHTTDLPEE
ncbi:hypothetical protein [Nonomuraea rhodomycinica]|uniref:TetR/AcrR family transcriptional regulator n=1 Tax=Nonomuraea rhodomycinica TaxID=1712872 RepID=A0A7Y6ILT6_9ACTN|nr:hypothetical protein [Nonomuraea rhodomycinica]NUW40627.1 hypothetical protein [Nonomuraea rhodomycinica]